MRRSALCLALVLAGSASASAARNYAGHHPNPEPPGGFCYVDGVHPHDYEPPARIAHLFRQQGNAVYFVGDPYFFGYTRPAYPYDGHHPIHPVFGGTWCFLDGPHYHFFHPHVDEVRQYTIFGGRYYYIGPVTPDYHQHRPAYYVEPPPSWPAAFAPLYATRNHYALYYGRPASVRYVVRGKLPRRHFVAGMYAGAFFGLPGFHAGVAVGMPGFSAHVGVGVPAVGFGVGVAPPPGVVVVPPPGAPPGWYRGKKKGWWKKRGKWKWKRGKWKWD